ncbi:MAG: hypothetical protein A2Y25_04225 [Candidatus Melainabacteria bacterium GWF2_37_15]|nr:MAG: hypothetical protein A2Y25_04225 [Candidatus Melainabacteria bacterium GWF2_37_15]
MNKNIKEELSKELKDIGARVREIREAKGYSMSKLAAMSGYQLKSVSNYELGERKVSVEYLKFLRDKFNANLEYIFTGNGKMFIDKAGEEKKEILSLLMEKYRVEDKEVEAVLKTYINSESAREFINQFIKAKNKDKRAFEYIMNIVAGMRVLFD